MYPTRGRGLLAKQIPAAGSLPLWGPTITSVLGWWWAEPAISQSGENSGESRIN